MNPRSRTAIRWTLPLACAVLLVTVDLVVAKVTQLRVLPRGAVAPHTVRAATDAVFDLRKTYADAAKAARRNFVPIYNKDNAVFYTVRSTITEAALRRTWRWPQAVDDGGIGDGGSTDAIDDSSAGDGTVARPPAVGPDGGQTRGDGPWLVEGGVTGDAAVVDDRLVAEHRRELHALLGGFFELLEPYYKRGVVADSEFPSQKERVRVFSTVSATGDERVPPTETALAFPRYVLLKVSALHRFSDLRPALEKSARQFFFKTDAALRDQVMDFILDRLPPNLTYAKENKRVIDISEVTGVKVVLIRRGEILAERGKIVSSRAYHAMRASVAAAERVSPLQRAAAELALLAGLLLLFIIAAKEVAPAIDQRLRAQLLLYGGIVVLGGVGLLTLAYFPVHATLVPQAALAMIFAVVLGRGPAMLVAVVVPAALSAVHVLDLASLAVGIAGGFSAALVVRPRRRDGVMSAAILVGVVQAVMLEAIRAAAGRPQSSPELLAAAQAFGGGLLAGGTALVALPFVQRWFGLCSRGTLMVLGDFEHPLARRLRERMPGVFAHTVRVISLADRAANAIGADRLLTRCGALYHDIGRIESGPYDGEADEETSVGEAAARELKHLEAGMQIAETSRVPAEVRRLIVEHHGTLPMPAPSTDRYPGPKPRSVESAVLLIANQVERASNHRAAGGSIDEAALVDGVIGELLAEFQFEECPLTQSDLRKIREALVDYLRE